MREVDFSNAKTTVFWDVDDFPITEDGHSICDRIKSALLSEGYHGGVYSIKAYGEKKPQNLSLDDDGVIDFTKKSGNPGRLKRLIFEIGLWAIDFDGCKFVPENLMIIAKINQDEVEFIDYLSEMHRFYVYCNVLLVVDHDNIGGPAVTRLAMCLSEIWLWKELLAEGKALDQKKVEELAARHEGLTLPDTFRVFEDEEYVSVEDGDYVCEVDEDGEDDCPVSEKEKE